MEKERVIFRREYDPYMKMWGYIAGFPDDPANLGRMVVLPFQILENGDYLYECFDEATIDYFLSKKIIHKNDPIVPELLKALEKRIDYETEFKVVEKRR